MVEINNLSGVGIEKVFLGKIAEGIFKKGDLSIALVRLAEIKKLNKKYRKRNKATDVLSFEEINEIIICPQVVKTNAKKYGVAFKKELAKVLIHGILHILGYDHEKSVKEEKIMREKEEFFYRKVMRQEDSTSCARRRFL